METLIVEDVADNHIPLRRCRSKTSHTLCAGVAHLLRSTGGRRCSCFTLKTHVPLRRCLSKVWLIFQLQIFSPYGCVEEVFLLRDEQKQNRGMGFITFTHKDMAVASINGLHGNYVMKGCDQPLVVRFADPKKPKTWENRCAPYMNDPVGQTSLLPNNTSHMDMYSHTGTGNGNGNRSEPPSVSSSTTCVPGPGPTTSSEMAVDLADADADADCDWSEHICPDGNAYYYNSVTSESLWEKPEEYSYYEQLLDKCHY